MRTFIKRIFKALFGVELRLRRAETDYHVYHAREAAAHLKKVRGKDVLVIGCNTGKDCDLFIRQGAREVHGIDVIDDVGAEYPHPRAKYHRMSVERMDLPSDRYDLVYSVATMEHVPRIDQGFAEMVRVARPGGLIYCVSAPLWNSRWGHHKQDFFPGFPWIHLRLTQAEILEYCRKSNIVDPGGQDMSAHVEYMLNPKFFNKLPARAYIEACAGLPGLAILNNDLRLDEGLTPEIHAELRDYPREELLADVHTFIARKL